MKGERVRAAEVLSDDASGRVPAVQLDTPAPSEPFLELYRAQLLPMTRLAHLITGSNAAAEDLVHDAFLKVGARLDSVDTPVAYLRTTVVNECRMWMRRREVERRHALAPRFDRESVPAEIGPEAVEMWRALAELTPRRRTALVLRFYADLTVPDIAETMGCRVGTVKSLIHRGLASLKEVLTDAD